MVSWAFCQFREMLEYKAALSQSEVLAADPKYTSQSCPVVITPVTAYSTAKLMLLSVTVSLCRIPTDRTTLAGVLPVCRKEF